MNRFLVLGHPRSATLYTAYLWEKLGLHVGHEIDEEHVKKVHGIETRFDGVVSGVFKNMSFAPENYDVVLHQVRNPLNVISSVRQAKGRLGFNTINTFAPHLLEGLRENLLYRSMLSWMVFTDMADAISCFTYQVEQIHIHFLHIARDILQIPTRAKRSPHMLQKVNVGKHVTFTYEDLELIDKDLTEQIREKAKRYGY